MPIFQLPSDQYHTLTKLFSDNYPDKAVVHAILEKRMPGEIWVDDVNQLSACLIKSNANICFIAGDVNESLFREFYKKIKSKLIIRLVYEDNSKNPIKLSKFGLTSINRLYFKFKNNLRDYSAVPNNSSFELVPLDKTNVTALKSSFSFLDGKQLYGGEENCIQQAWGLALWDKTKNRIASEVVGVTAEKYVELSVITHPNYRQQNLAKIVCSQFIIDILATGREPIWACDKNNINSIKLAKALGFEHLRDYQFKIFMKEKVYLFLLRAYRSMKRRLKKLSSILKVKYPK